MNDKKRKILQPAYLNNFKCIGSSCEDSCCIGWRVDLDKKTYLSYKSVQNDMLKPVISKMIVRKHNHLSDDNYGTIKMDSKGRCPFMNKKNLCNIHATLGEEYLSEICTVYPRLMRKIDGKFERSATMSCPEIARLGLLNPEGIIFENIEEDAEKRIKIYSTFDTEGHLFLKKPQRYFWDIRIFSLSLLQNRKYNLGERLIVLGIVYKEIEKLTIQGQAKDIPTLLEQITNLIESESLKEELDNVPANLQIQMRLAKELTDERAIQGITSQRYMQSLKETLLGINYREGEQIETVLKKYKENYENYLLPYLEEKEYIIENFLVNEYFKESMPFGEFKTMWDSYVFLCILYSMLKLHLIGIAGYYKTIDDDITLRFIQSFSKVILHNRIFINGIIKLISDSGYDSLAYMSILVKN